MGGKPATGNKPKSARIWNKSRSSVGDGPKMLLGNEIKNTGRNAKMWIKNGRDNLANAPKMLIRNSNEYAPNAKMCFRNAGDCSGQQATMQRMDSLFHRSQFLHKDFNATIDLATKRFGDDVFYYCDPPYFETEAVYGMPPFDHAGLRQALEGKNCMVSYDDCEYIRNLYEGWDIVDIEVSKQSMKGGKKIRKEILIMSHDNSINEI